MVISSLVKDKHRMEQVTRICIANLQFQPRSHVIPKPTKLPAKTPTKNPKQISRP